MYQILFVDDEAVERNVIRHLLTQNNFPLELSEAANGKIALELLRKKKFDILLTDVLMPFVDGLTLAAEAQKLYPDIQLIFFSGHNDFDYVKKALSLHAINYILKPIDPDEFQNTILNVLGNIQTHEKLNQEKKISFDITQNHILYKIINKTSIDSLKLRYPQLDFSFVYDCHRLILLQMEQDYFGTDQDSTDRFLFPNDLNKFLSNHCYYINLNPSQSLILFDGPRHPLSWYQSLADKLMLHIQNNLHSRCRIAISKSFSAPEDIPLAYEEAERTLTENFFQNILIDSHDPRPALSALPPENSDALMKQLHMDIQFKDAVRLKQHITLLIDSLRSRMHSQIYCRFICTNVLKLLLDGFPEDTQQKFDEYAKTISISVHMAPIESLLLRLTDELTAIFEHEQDSPRHALQQVKQYIHNHYPNDLSLDILAKTVYLSPQYLSALFIEQNGYGLNKYIKNVRMEKARDLLLNTDLSVKDISQRVGYSNLSYFCKSFATDFGMTPDRFRTQNYKSSEGNE
ncbi:MAG: response regulator [Lachnospiraceae bacterium]|nr:response regulator [Lachnospiraceae bacterium]